MEYIEKDLKRTKWFDIKEVENVGEFELLFRITDGSIDYHNEIVNPDGVKFADRIRILYGHENGIPAPAKLAWPPKRINGEWLVKIIFDMNDPLGVLLYNKYKNNFMSDCSIGFMSNPKARTRNENDVLVHNDIEVFEISLVNIGANSNAHRLSIEDCDYVIKSATNPKVKQDFVNIKNQKIMEENFEKINKRLDEIISRIDTAETNIKDIINNKSIEEIEVADEPEIVEEKEIENKDEMDPEVLKAVKELNNKIAKLEKII